MNAHMRKMLVLAMALCLGLVALPARSFAIGEAGTFYVQPEFGLYGTSQEAVKSIITFGASGGYFVMDGLMIGAEALAYSFDQDKISKNSSFYGAARSEGYSQNPWAFGANALVRYYPVHTDRVGVYVGSGIGGLFSSDRIPFYSNGGEGSYTNLTVPVDLGIAISLTQNVAFEVAGRYQRIGFDNHGLDSWGGHVGLRITF
jgi:opacity protein-like surface antigen